MSHEVLITRRQTIFIFFCKSRELKASASSTSQHRPSEAPSSLDLQRNKKFFVFWLSGPHGTSNFDQQSLIHSNLNYTNGEYKELPLIMKIHSKMLQVKEQGRKDFKRVFLKLTCFLKLEYGENLHAL